MQRILLFLALFTATAGAQAQTVLEDFEGGVADLTWEAVNGTFAGAILNPEDSLANQSEFVGSYTKDSVRAFSLFRAMVDEPLDLSANNRFSIQVYAGAATELIVKLEGEGESIEKRVNITAPNVWRTYTFDFFDAREFTTLNTIILFFDPGEAESGDTYLFDNLIANPSDACSGTEVSALIIDDFECQRNASYRGGFDDISVVVNPDQSGVNETDSVGRYEDQMGGFAALVVNYDNGIDLSENNYVCIDVWAPVAGNLLVKLEGGISAPFEVANQIETTMEWTRVCVDFSSQAAANHSQIVFFFNAGQDGSDDIYFVDNITRGPTPEQPEVPALEDFEDGARLTWGPANDNTTVNGTYNGVVANPDATGANNSDNAGSYTRASTNFSTVSAELTAGLDLGDNPQMNLDVLLPEGSGGAVTLQLVSALEGVKSVAVTGVATGSWQTVSFNFGDFSAITDFFRVNVLFDPGTMGTDTYFYDNLRQGVSTVDPCAEIATDPDILDDFECQRNATFTGGADGLTVVPNPDVSPANPSLVVGQFIDPPGAFNVLLIDNGDDNPYGFELKNQLTAKIWAPVAGEVLFKLEGGPNPPVEIFQTIPATEEWVDYTVDLSGAAGQGHTRIALFFGARVDNPAANTYYIDDIALARAPFTADCITTFEPGDLSLEDYNYFGNGTLEDEQFTIVENPDVSEGNGSANVASFLEANDGQQFAGLASTPIAPIVIGENKTVTLKMWMPVEGQVVIKLERPRGDAIGSGDVAADYTTAGEWQTLTFDISTAQNGNPLETGFAYDRFTIIPNFGVVPDETLTHYFDDIAIGGAECGTTGLFSPVTIAELRVYPNPASERLTIDNPAEATDFSVHNLLGQQLQTLRTERGLERVDLDIHALPRGTYVLTARGQGGRVLARTKFVKE